MLHLSGFKGPLAGQLTRQRKDFVTNSPVAEQDTAQLLKHCALLQARKSTQVHRLSILPTEAKLSAPPRLEIEATASPQLPILFPTLQENLFVVVYR